MSVGPGARLPRSSGRHWKTPDYALVTARTTAMQALRDQRMSQ